jgi:lactate dehydrogenase-like 2-hydroxyacid dehydrogenase
MKSLRYLLLFVFICFGFQKTAAQVYRFKTSSMSVMDKNEKGAWNNWSDFKKADIISFHVPLTPQTRNLFNKNVNKKLT